MEVLCKSPLFTDVADRYRYRINWFVVYMITLLNGISPFIQIPSLHQFITSSRNQTNPNVEAGLGLSETWYSVVVSILSVGAFTGAICFGLLAKHVYIKLLFLLELLLAFVGGLLYSFSINGFMILSARFLIGMFTGVHMAAMRVYIFETSSKLIEALPIEKRNKSTIKYTAIFLMICLGQFARAFAPGLVAIGAQFDSISEFHWPGYYMSVHAFCLIIFVLIGFNERWSDLARKSKAEKPRSIKARILSEIRTPSIPHCLSFVFVYLFVVMGWNLSVLETLLNPILSDQFGLDVKNTAYVLAGVLLVYILSLIITYGLQKIKIDNRKIVIVSLLIGTIGSLIMIDWQAMGGDPCNQFNDNTTTLDEEYKSDNISNSLECEAYGDNNGHRCFWNPVSRISGDYCERCRTVCLGKDHSIDFVQLLVGLAMLCYSLVPGRVLISTIASDIAQGKSVASLMAVLVAAGAVSQATGPLWTNSSYIAVHHRTWLTMITLSVIQLIGLILLLVVYRAMEKRVVYVVAADNGHSLLVNGEDQVELLSMEDMVNDDNDICGEDMEIYSESKIQ